MIRSTTLTVPCHALARSLSLTITRTTNAKAAIVTPSVKKFGAYDVEIVTEDEAAELADLLVASEN